MAESQQTITCPECKCEIPLDEALRHKVGESILQEERKRYQEELKKQTDEFEQEKLKIKQKVREELSKEQSLELEDAKKQLEEKESKLTEFRESELALRAEKRKLEEEKEELKLTVQRELDKEKAKLIEQAQKDAQQAQHLKIEEKEQTIKRLMKDLEDANRRAAQGSQQLQGEVLELELEKLLKSEFPLDNIEEVKKGARGADVTQKVRLRTGQACGTILWETKNGKWQASWISTLKENMRQAKAEYGVLVLEQCPEDIKGYTFRDGVWLADRLTALPLAYALRVMLGQVFTVRQSSKGKDEKMEALYNYLIGPEFLHRIEAIVEAFGNLKQENDRERKAMLQKWARQEKELGRVMEHTVGIYGDLQGITSRALPAIKHLELIEASEVEDEDDQK